MNEVKFNSQYRRFSLFHSGNRGSNPLGDANTPAIHPPIRRSQQATKTRHAGGSVTGQSTADKAPLGDSLITGNESFELIALCEQILEDSEVTAGEVTALGDWLAAHEETRRTWPGTVLAKPIEDALLDRSVNKTELRKIASLLRRVQKEWVARRDEKVKQAAAEKAAAVVRTMDLSQPLLPSIPITLHVKSHSDDSLVYEVDLTGPSCTCQDWVGARSGLPRGSLTRCCKQVLDAYSRLRPAGGWPSWLDAFLENGWKPHPDKRWFVVRIGPDFALISSGGNDWADAFTSAGGKYHRFGFNLVERRWAYGREPDGATQIERELLKQTGGTSGGIFRRLFGLK